MSNTLQQILTRLSQGTVTQGWGAIAVFSGDRINERLARQFVDAFSAVDSVKLLKGQTFLGEDDGQVATFKDLQLGPPVLSFPSDPLTNARVRVTFKLLSGRYQVRSRNSSVPRTLQTTFNINALQALEVALDVELEWVVNAASQIGRVRFDLADSLSVSCNLAGSDTQANERLAAVLKDKIAGLPFYQRVFVVSTIKLWRESPLAVQEVRVQTQAALGARIPGAVNYGAGAVVVMLRLWADTVAGTYPLGSTFPWLIPDDAPPDGGRAWSETLIVSNRLIKYLATSRQKLLDSVLPSRDDEFEEVVSEMPYDHAIFGRINPGKTSLTLEPVFVTVQAGGTQDFTLFDAQGRPLQASSWHASSYQSSRAAGHGTIINGRYTAASLEDIGHEILHVAITAEYLQDGQTLTASAMVTVLVFEDVSVAPRVGSYLKPIRAQPIDLAAFTLSGQQVQWSLSGTTAYGELARTGDHTARFAAREQQIERKGLMAQQIEATGHEASPSTLLLVNGQSLMGIEPYYATYIKRASSVQLHDDASVLPGLPRRWSVIGGFGSVVAGVFTAPVDKTAASNIVLCEVVHNDVVFCTGYSVVDLLEADEEPKWLKLDLFSVQANAFANPQRATPYGNGFQQLQVTIKVQSASLDGATTEVSDQELAVLFMDGIGHDNLDLIDPDLEGIPEGAGELWQISMERSKTYNLAGDAAAQSPPLMTAPGEGVIKTRTRYLHARAADNATNVISAEFLAATGSTFYSDEPKTSVSAIEITIRNAPSFREDDYKLEFARPASQQSLDEPDDAYFDMVLNTDDYWQFSHTTVQGQKTQFVTCEFFDPKNEPISHSMIRWESELYWETMFSYTGYIFGSAGAPAGTPIRFDESLKDIIPVSLLEQKKVVGSPDAASLTITLHRSDSVAFVHGTESRIKLYRPLYVKLRDKDGNVHYRSFNFRTKAAGWVDRNRIFSSRPQVPDTSVPHP